MSTHNIRFHREIRKILCGYPLLSVAMSTSIAYYIWDFFLSNVCFTPFFADPAISPELGPSLDCSAIGAMI